jgi:hypothetical protein
VRFSWRALAAVAGALLLAFALLVVSYQESVDSSGLAVQDMLAGLAVLAVGLMGYLVGRPWVLLVPWAVAVSWLVVGVIVEAADPSGDSAELSGAVLLLVYPFWADVLLVGGLAVAVIRDRHGRQRSAARNG